MPRKPGCDHEKRCAANPAKIYDASRCFSRASNINSLFWHSSRRACSCFFSSSETVAAESVDSAGESGGGSVADGGLGTELAPRNSSRTWEGASAYTRWSILWHFLARRYLTMRVFIRADKSSLVGNASNPTAPFLLNDSRVWAKSFSSGDLPAIDGSVIVSSSTKLCSLEATTVESPLLTVSFLRFEASDAPSYNMRCAFSLRHLS